MIIIINLTTCWLLELKLNLNLKLSLRLVEWVIKPSKVIRKLKNWKLEL